jgi:hypothetical protein
MVIVDCYYPGNWFGVEGAKSIAVALEKNQSVTIINLGCESFDCFVK